MQKNVKEGISNETINLKACRFCLKVSRSKIQIDEKIKTTYLDLMHEKLIDTLKLPQSCCKTCISELEQCVSTKNKISSNQKFLLELAGLDTKQEPDLLDTQTFELKTEIEEEEEKVEAFTFEYDQNLEQEPEKDTDNDPNYSCDHQIPSAKSKDSDKEFKIKKYPPKKVRKTYGENERMVKCDDCEKILSSFKSLKNHRKRFHPLSETTTENPWIKERLEEDKRQTVKCPECDREFHKLFIFKHRISAHNIKIKQPYKCDYCGAQYQGRSAMLKHMMTKHSEDKDRWSCDKCGKIMSSKYKLKMHQASFHVHKNDSPYVCHYCGYQSKTLASHKLHIQSKHIGEKPFQCDLCSMRFFSASTFNAHRRKKHASKTETCEICSKVFMSKYNLHDHMRNVHDEKKFICPIEGCGRKYPAQIRLNDHLYKHTGLKKFVCTTCHQSFKTRTGIQSHVRALHLNFTIKCPVPNCPDKFHRIDYSRTHIRKKHANLGQTEVNRLDQIAKSVKVPSAFPHYRSTLNEVDAEKFEKFKKDSVMYRHLFPDFKLRVENDNEKQDESE